MVLGKQLLYVRFATREKKSFQKIWNHLMYNFSSDQKRKHPMAWFLANRLFKLIITVTEVQKKNLILPTNLKEGVYLSPGMCIQSEQMKITWNRMRQQHTQAQSAKLFSGC